MYRALVCLVLVSGCINDAYDNRRLLAHPTMTPEAIAWGQGARVTAITEGAHGTPKPTMVTDDGDVVITPR